MAYIKVNSRGTEFAVDWDVVERMCKSYWITAWQYEYAEPITLSESSWYNPLSWSLPSIQNVEVPWARVRSAAQTSCDRDMSIYRQSASNDMRGIALDVKFKLEQTVAKRRHFQNYLKDIQSTNMKEIEKSVKDYTGLAEAARFIRDTSADVVAIGSTIATGGAAAGLLGASSAMKGWGKYQDTGSVGAAALYGTGSLALGVFKVGGAKLTTAGEYTLIIVQGTLEAGTGLVAGDTFATAVGKGSLKVASAGAAHALFSAGWVKQVFSRIPVPFEVWVKQAGKQMWVDEANDLVEKTAKKLTEKGAKALIVTVVRPAPVPAAQRTVSVGLLDEVPVEQMLLLHFSIVNMQKGIGHGW